MSEFEHGSLLFGAAKSETNYGVDAFGGSAPSAGEWNMFRMLEIEPIVEHQENDRATATISGEPSVPIKSHCAVRWAVPLLGKADTDEGPAYDALLMACGLERTVDTGVDVAYTPYSHNDMTNTPSATIVKYLTNNEGKAKKLLARGFRSNFELVLEVGSVGYIQGEGQALYDDEPTAWSTAPTLPVAYDADKTPLPVTLITATIGGNTWKVERLTLPSNWNITRILGGDDTGGGATSDVLLDKPMSGNRFGGQILFAGGATALADIIAKVRNGDTLSLAAQVGDGTDTIDLTAPAMQLTAMARQVAGIAKRQIDYRLNREQGASSSGHDDFELAWS